jgi:hypothetical protein
MCLSAKFHGENARVLRSAVPASRALGWTDQEYPTMTRAELHIGYRRSQHPDRIEAHLTHELRVRDEISLEKVKLISRRLRPRVRLVDFQKNIK